MSNSFDPEVEVGGAPVESTPLSDDIFDGLKMPSNDPSSPQPDTSIGISERNRRKKTLLPLVLIKEYLLGASLNPRKRLMANLLPR